MPPVIAIAPCRTLPDYEESVRRAGGNPRVLDWAGDPVARVLATCDGVLIPGGIDVNPASYGQGVHPTVTDVSDERDAYEIALVRAALAADMPILAICRGMQVMNVAMGGTLVQDIPSQIESDLKHAIVNPKNAIAHVVWVTPGSRLAELMREELSEGDTLQVNSRHHQSVSRLAEGFDVTATAPDGIIEAMEHRSARFCLGVQWHPENFWRTGEFRPLFEGFVAASTT
ncbi:MAG: gamma-glutamyl-gamma-aminobutyrate hydrolase family protein [Acidobacteria bacterium]|nr:gamma-glutamyl-gamma-aminobutyrate hydrolase family protein [Acidobacteriota bacterium]